uniref:RHD domain-containing protein n=1 Tax=Panagrolaimus sp. PS1159 TaxID=55785 RepID=A0AC35FH91_9BILA
MEPRLRLQPNFLGPEDQYAENTTVITGNTSEHSYSGITERFYIQPQPFVKVTARRCSRICWLISSIIISIIALLSAPTMIFIPFLLNKLEYDWPEIICDVECQGNLLNICVKSVLLISAFYVMFWRKSTSDMPRLYLPRAAFAFFVLFCLFAFWLFFIFRFIFEQNLNYSVAVAYALSLLDVLVFIHCIWIFYEIRQNRPQFIVTIIRDPDGESKTLSIGDVSIQQAAVEILQFYLTNFSSYNPYLERSRRNDMIRNKANLPQSSRFKIYDIEGFGQDSLNEASARALMEAAAAKMNCHNERLYEEIEWEKRLKKRKYRLIGCAEDAFGYVQAVSPTSTNYRGETMTSAKMASTVLGGIARPLNRYLKITRQQPHHLPAAVVQYLDKCLKYRFSARTFLQRFFSERFPPQEAVLAEAKWTILCERQASSDIFHGLEFVLRSHNQTSDIGVQLYCTFETLPFLNITEQSEKRALKFAFKTEP